MSCIFCVFKQKTAYELRISDWSSDVCSSDLLGQDAGRDEIAPLLELGLVSGGADLHVQRDVELIAQLCCALGRFADAFMPGRNRRQGGRERCREVEAGLSHASVVHTEQIGRASCRERVCQYE